MKYQVITENDQLHHVTMVCSKAPVITIDTEFARVNTYYPEVGLIQIYNGEQCFLIDPIALPDLNPLRDLMISPSVLKVFHSCSEDLEVFQHAMGIIPSPIFDTQIGAAFLGIGFSESYILVRGMLKENYETLVWNASRSRGKGGRLRRLQAVHGWI